MADIYAYITHKNGVADDSAFELITAARKIDAGASVTAIVTGSGGDVDPVAEAMAAVYPQVIKFNLEALGYPNADVVAIDGVEGDTLNVIRQEYAGMVSTHMSAAMANGVVINIRPGSFSPDESQSAGGSVSDRSGDAGDLTTRRTFLEVVDAEMGDVDITKSDVLVSVGRGIEDEENIEVAQDLADAMGAVVSCSRPIVDAKWLEKSRQVGTSGQTVKPKVYLACGISGSFQHLGGIKGSPFIVAINKNVKAPIFQVADVGIEADILDFLPELTEAIEKG
jgi:electron transfer flavoprotein alpha subunit